MSERNAECPWCGKRRYPGAECFTEKEARDCPDYGIKKPPKKEPTP